MRLLIGLLFWVLLSSGLAGCVADSDDSDGPASGTDANQAAAGTYVPWVLSDYWAFDMDVAGFERYTQTKLVYYEESGPEFVVGTPSAGEALYHAVFSVNPILGRVHKELLSPHEQGTHAHMFPFHSGARIEDGQVWTTVFYERQLQLEATYDEAIATPLGAKPGFRIHGDDPNSAFAIDYTYVPAVKWFTELRVYDGAGQLFHLRLTEQGTGYSGPAHFIRAKDLFHETIEADGLLPVERTFQIGASEVDGARVESLAISTHIDLASGLSARVEILDPQGAVIYRRDHDTPADGEFDIQQVWPEGTPSTDKPLGSRPQWTAGTYMVRLTVSGNAEAELHVVGTQDNSGSV